MRFFFFDIKSDEDIIDDKSDDDGSGSGLSGTGPFLFFEISVDGVSRIFQSEYFPAQKLSSFKLLYAFVSLTLSTATSAPGLDASQSMFKLTPPVTFKLYSLVDVAKTEFNLPVALMDKSSKSVNFGL